MKHIESLTRYVANFVDALAHSGLEHVVISPGSRSTPLAMMFCEHASIQEWIVVDERSAAYFALGIAKRTKKSVALLCTSGTAAANYYPAIIEAHYNRVPLIILTADRPHELRDVGAPQAIDQIKMYGDHVKWFQEMPLPEMNGEMLQYVRTVANRAIQISNNDHPGPVQLNFPFREPLIPDFSLENIWGEKVDIEPFEVAEGKRQLSKEKREELYTQLKNATKGLIVCGPQENPYLAGAIARLSEAWEIPVLADPLSQLRGGKHSKAYIIENYDAMFRSEEIRKRLKPDFILRFGAMPISKAYSFYAQEHADSLHFVVDSSFSYRQPTKQRTLFLYDDPILLIEEWLKISADKQIDRNWFNEWKIYNEYTAKLIQQTKTNPLTEGEAVRTLVEVLPDSSILYVGNSMAVRDLDTFFLRTDKQIHLLANRGASGIEGLISSALGASISTERNVTLILGDLSFYHDLNGLHIAKHYDIDLTILLINNNGGGIFSFLPQAKEKKHFEKLFGTPLDLDFQPIVKAYGGTYKRVREADELRQALKKSYETKGLSVVEVRTDRQENEKWHHELWHNIKQRLLSKDDPDESQS